MSTPFRDLRPSGFRSTAALLLALLLGINALAIGTVVAARGRVKAAAARELERRTESHARALEAALAATRGDLLFLAQSGSLRHLLDTATDPDPYRQRWGRLDAEAAALLFLRSHPEITRLVATDEAGTPLLAVGRRGGAPIALPPPDPSGRPARIPVPPKGEVLPLRVEVDLAPEGLLGKLSTGDAAYVLRDRADPATPPETAAGGQLTAAVPVTDLAWHPPVSWTLRSRESEGDVLRSVEHFATDFRNTVVLNVALVVLASLLGFMAMREVRAVERLESERRNLAKVRELELGLMHRDRLAALGRIAAGIAHEINNPLEGMSNYLRLAEDDLAAGETAEAKRHLEGVAHGLERVAGIVHQTLAQAGDGRGAKDCIDLVPLVGRTLDFARDDPKARGVRVHPAAADGPAPVYGNATTLGQLVLNLVLNACEAQPDGGEVQVTLAHPRTGIVALAVEDRGPGIEEEDLENVFEPFYSTKGSTGLGLFLCHSIAADHGGTLVAMRREGGGARFVLELPLAKHGGPD